MKASTLLLTLAVALMCIAPTTAAGKGNKKGGKKSEPAKVAPADEDPVAVLKPFMQNAGQLLALNRSGNKSFATQTPSRIIIIRAQLAAQRASAEPVEQPRFDAALATCDAISRSLDERQKFISQLEASKAVKPSGQLNRRRIDNPSSTEYEREQREIKEAEAVAKKTEEAFNAAARNRWTQRSIELRQQIEAAYARIAVADEG